jgi:hypothetical protein
MQGTTWLELWITFEMRLGACPHGPEPERRLAPLERRPSARARMMAFTAASRWLLGPRGVDWHQLCGGPTRTMAFRHLAVANTFSALDARVRWDENEFMEIQRRVLLLRRTAAEVITNCQGGRSADLRVKKLNLVAPPPWADSPWRPDRPAPEHHRHCRGGGRRLFHFYCPWAA